MRMTHAINGIYKLISFFELMIYMIGPRKRMYSHVVYI